jgi:hypothetical protein
MRCQIYRKLHRNGPGEAQSSKSDDILDDKMDKHSKAAPLIVTMQPKVSRVQRPRGVEVHIRVLHTKQTRWLANGM